MTEEIALFAMFAIIDTNVPNNVQQDMAEKHLKLKPNHTMDLKTDSEKTMESQDFHQSVKKHV